MQPASQNLEAFDPAGAKVCEGLKVRLEFLVFDRLVDVFLYCHWVSYLKGQPRETSVFLIEDIPQGIVF